MTTLTEILPPTSEHAALAPSFSNVWWVCALAPTMAAKFPEQGDAEPARRGSASHWVGQELHERRPVALGTVAPNGVTVDENILETGEHFASSIHPDGGAGWTVERTVISKAIHDSLNWGTHDAWRFDGKVLDVTDWKGGHEFVEVFENTQLINYFALIWVLYFFGYDDTQVKVRFRIVQPNAYHADGPVRTWTVRASDLRPFINKLRNAADRATQPDPEATPGAHCEYCPGRNACQALERSALHHATWGRRPGVIDIVPLPAQARELAYLLESREILNALITGREQEIQNALAAGQRVPGFTLERGQGRETWTRPTAEVAAIGAMLGVKLTKDALITPNQAREKGMPAELVQTMSARPSGALKLTRVNAEKMASMFGR